MSNIHQSRQTASKCRNITKGSHGFISSSPLLLTNNGKYRISPSTSLAASPLLSQNGYLCLDQLSEPDSLLIGSDDFSGSIKEPFDPTKPSEEEFKDRDKIYPNLEKSETFRYIKDSCGRGPFTKPHILTSNPSAPFSGPHTAILITRGPDVGQWIHVPQDLPEEVVRLASDILLWVWEIRDNAGKGRLETLIDEDNLKGSLRTPIPNSISRCTWKLLGPPGAAYPLTASPEVPFSGPQTIISNCGNYFGGYFLHIPRLLTSEQITTCQHNLARLCMEKWDWGGENDTIAHISIRTTTAETLEAVSIYQNQKRAANFLEKDLGFDFSVQDIMKEGEYSAKELWEKRNLTPYVPLSFRVNCRANAPHLQLHRRPNIIIDVIPEASDSGQEEDFPGDDMDSEEYFQIQAIGRRAKRYLQAELDRRLEETGTNERRPGWKHNDYISRNPNGRRYSGSTATSDESIIASVPDIKDERGSRLEMLVVEMNHEKEEEKEDAGARINQSLASRRNSCSTSSPGKPVPGSIVTMSREDHRRLPQQNRCQSSPSSGSLRPPTNPQLNLEQPAHEALPSTPPKPLKIARDRSDQLLLRQSSSTVSLQESAAGSTLSSDDFVNDGEFFIASTPPHNTCQIDLKEVEEVFRTYLSHKDCGPIFPTVDISDAAGPTPSAAELEQLAKQLEKKLQQALVSRELNRNFDHNPSGLSYTSDTLWSQERKRLILEGLSIVRDIVKDLHTIAENGCLLPLVQEEASHTYPTNLQMVRLVEEPRNIWFWALSQGFALGMFSYCILYGFIKYIKIGNEH